jgi:hypothetical protein
MKNKTYIILMVLFSISLGCIIGFYGGSQFAKKRIDNYYTQIHFNGIATELKTYLRVLEQLQKKNVESGIELLERFIDVNLDSLSIYGNKPAADRSEEIIAIIGEVRDYRKKYSKHKVNPILSSSVQRALNLAK